MTADVTRFKTFRQFTEALWGHEAYILEGHRPVAASMRAWAEWRDNAAENAPFRLAKTRWPGTMVSTIFNGLAVSFGPGPDQLFETMIFSTYGNDDGHQVRAATWDEAMRNHRAIVAEIASALGPPDHHREAP